MYQVYGMQYPPLLELKAFGYHTPVIAVTQVHRARLHTLPASRTIVQRETH